MKKIKESTKGEEEKKTQVNCWVAVGELRVPIWLARLAMVSYSPRHHLFIIFIFLFIFSAVLSLSDDDDDVDIKEEEEKRSKKKNLSKHHKSPAFSAPAHQQII